MVLAALGAACGDEAPKAPATTERALPSLVAPPAGPGDVVVARVDDRPVWGSCVAAQAEAHGKSARAALEDCIGLELAAQEAERRGLARDPEVALAYDRALASALVDREFSARVKTTADLPAAFVEGIWAKNAWRMDRREYRGSFFARIELTDPEGSPADLAAGEAARAAYAALAGRSDLFPEDVEAALRAAARPGQTVTAATPEAATFGEGSRLQAYYHEPLFAIEQIGQVAPPVRGPYGWDLILYTSRLEPWKRTRDEVLAELFPAMRLRYFMDWTSRLGQGHVEIVRHDDATLRELLGGEE